MDTYDKMFLAGVRAGAEFPRAGDMSDEVVLQMTGLALFKARAKHIPTVQQEPAAEQPRRGRRSA